MASSQHRCVFVGNIPYDATEEQLIQICEEVGPVVSFRLVLDRETGKPKGYGFCEYKDEETALSARRNLQGYEINGRQLRVDFAENDKGADRNREQGRGGPGLASNIDAQKPSGSKAVHGNLSLHQAIGMQSAVAAASAIAGALGERQSSNRQSKQAGFQGQSNLGNDLLTHYLAKMSRAYLYEVMSEFKAMATQNKALARQLLLASPHLSRALFQAQIMLGIVSPQALQGLNIQQSSSSFLQPSLQDDKQPVHPSIVSQALGGTKLPARLHPGLTEGQDGQTVLKAGVMPVSSIMPQQPSSGLSVRQHTSSMDVLKQQIQAPLVQQQVAVAGPAGRHSQLSLPSSSTPWPLPSQDVMDTTSRDGVSTALLGNDSPWGPWSDTGHPTTQPSKLRRLEDGKSVSHVVNTNMSAQGFGTSTAAASSAGPFEAAQQSEKQVSQLALPPEVESALLQQVMSLTAEQLSSLPPEQRQQVLQLQQMLR